MAGAEVVRLSYCVGDYACEAVDARTGAVVFTAVTTFTVSGDCYTPHQCNLDHVVGCTRKQVNPNEHTQPGPFSRDVKDHSAENISCCMMMTSISIPQIFLLCFRFR